MDIEPGSVLDLGFNWPGVVCPEDEWRWEARWGKGELWGLEFFGGLGILGLTATCGGEYDNNDSFGNEINKELNEISNYVK